jgi:predicted NAD/FAD-binding protein
VGSAPDRRLAIIGGGMGGVSTAYFCDSGWVIDLFEARSDAGGNAATVVVQDDGEDVAVDLGAESFHPGTHPMYWRLLREIEDATPTGSLDDLLIPIPGTLSIFDAATRRTLFASTHPLRTPRRSIAFFRFARAARDFVDHDPSPDLTVGEWIDRLAIDRAFIREALLPWLASLTCFSVDKVRTQSVLSFLLLFVDVLPAGVLASSQTYCSRVGLGGILDVLIAGCRNLSIHTNAPVQRLEHADGWWYVETPGGRHGPYEKVVVNAAPHASADFLCDAPEDLLGILRRHEYYPTRIAIHRDPIVMPAARRDWCSHNAAVDGDSCEATIWLGAFRTNPKTGRPVQLFKSWATNRSPAPEDVVAEQTFLHALMSPETLRATEELASWQGVDGLYFTGHYTTVTDLQETALASGVAVASALCPGDARLVSFQRAVAASGRTRASSRVGPPWFEAPLRM